jgi:hypothetical protein
MPENNLGVEDDELHHLVESLQYGDPVDVKDELRTVMNKGIQQGIQDFVNNQRANAPFNSEGLKTQKAIAEFWRANPDVKTDTRANSIMNLNLQDELRSDIGKCLRTLGYTKQQYDENALTPQQLAHWWQHYKASGKFKMREYSELLQKAAEDFTSYTGRRLSPTGTPEEVASAVIKDRQRRAAQLKGRPIDPDTGVPSELMSTPDGGTMDARTYTKAWMGMGADEAAESGNGSDERHSRGFAQIKAGRFNSKGEKN